MYVWTYKENIPSSAFSQAFTGFTQKKQEEAEKTFTESGKWKNIEQLFFKKEVKIDL
jgi:hypothetical protein